MKKTDYYVFCGENATTGRPNSTTGNFSTYGEILLFHSKNSAIEYTENYRGYGICKAGNLAVMRKFCLGMTVNNFNEYVKYLEYV